MPRAALIPDTAASQARSVESEAAPRIAIEDTRALALTLCHRLIEAALEALDESGKPDSAPAERTTTRHHADGTTRHTWRTGCAIDHAFKAINLLTKLSPPDSAPSTDAEPRPFILQVAPEPVREGRIRA